jgi:hypothetical protein
MKSSLTINIYFSAEYPWLPVADHRSATTPVSLTPFAPRDMRQQQPSGSSTGIISLGKAHLGLLTSGRQYDIRGARILNGGRERGADIRGEVERLLPTLHAQAQAQGQGQADGSRTDSPPYFARAPFAPVPDHHERGGGGSTRTLR